MWRGHEAHEILQQPLPQAQGHGYLWRGCSGMLLGFQHPTRTSQQGLFRRKWDPEARWEAVVMPGAPRKQSHREWAAGEAALSRLGRVGRKWSCRSRKTGRRREWQGPWEAGRQERGESAWWGALKGGREAQAGQVLPQPGEPSPPGWHLLHPSLLTQGKRIALRTGAACRAAAPSFQDHAGVEPLWLLPLR